MSLSWKQYLQYAILICGIAFLYYRYSHSEPAKTYEAKADPHKVESPVPDKVITKAQKPVASNPEIPDYVEKVLDHILKYQDAPPNYVGGRIFDNRERRLKTKDNAGNKIQYQEWDVHPKLKGQNRGAERLITGSDHSAYFTSDHYQTFIQVK